MESEQKIYAALDLGTNNCRLSIAVEDKNIKTRYKIIDSYTKQVRLGEGLFLTNYLQIAAIERTLQALDICKKMLDKYDIYKARYVTTQACRKAKNKEDFLEKAYKSCSLRLEVISNIEEGYLAMLACKDIIALSPRPVLLFDIGGGSSQLCFINNPIKAAISSIIALDVGMLTIAEKFNHIPSPLDRFKLMVAYVIRKLKASKLDAAIEAPIYDLVGTSGTATTLAMISLNLPYYDRSKIDGFSMKQAEVRKLIHNISNIDSDLMLKIPWLGGGTRIDLMLAGCAILKAIMHLWPGENLYVADRGLRNGIFYSYIAQ